MASVQVEVRDGVAEITLDNPPANALTEGMVGALIAALHRAAGDPDTRVVIIRSAVDRRFCAGLDLAALDGAVPAKIRALLEQLYIGLHDAQCLLGKPSIAAVTGAARGGGMTLAISCDLLVAGESASFGYPEIDVGVLPAIHFTHLPRIVGRHRAFDLLFTGRSFGAAEASALGLVSRVVPDAAVLHAARQLAQQLAAKPQATLQAGRQAFIAACGSGDRDRLKSAVDVFCDVALSAQGREGVQAFAQKRLPAWRKGG
jgi:enoyl-CoA hydratase